MTMQDQQHNTPTSNQDCCNTACREQYASEHINFLIRQKERELYNLKIIRDMLPTNPTNDQNSEIGRAHV